MSPREVRPGGPERPPAAGVEHLADVGVGRKPSDAPLGPKTPEKALLPNPPTWVIRIIVTKQIQLHDFLTNYAKSILRFFFLNGTVFENSRKIRASREKT